MVIRGYESVRGREEEGHVRVHERKREGKGGGGRC